MLKFDQAYQQIQQYSRALTIRLDDFKAEIDEIREGKADLPPECPNRASAIQSFYLQRLQQDLDRMNSAMKDATAAIWQECGSSH